MTLEYTRICRNRSMWFTATHTPTISTQLNKTIPSSSWVSTVDSLDLAYMQTSCNHALQPL